MANLKKISIAKLNIALGYIATIAVVAASPLGNPALAEPLAFATPSGGFSIFDRVLREPASLQRSIGSAQDGAELPAHLRRQVVEFRTTEAAGTIIVDTPNTYLYLVHLITRNSFGLMTRKLSVTESQRSAQLRGTFSRRKLSVASANWAHVA
jgi:lipoprotein-anchoring transpeptidase ErfK/SrfK